MLALFDLGNGTGVIVFASVQSVRPVADVIAGWERAFGESKARGVERVVLDFSHNGGGVICYGYWFLVSFLFFSARRLLNGNSHKKMYLIPTFEAVPTDVRVTPIIRNFTKAATKKIREGGDVVVSSAYHYTSHVNISTLEPFPDDSFLIGDDLPW